MYPEYMYLQVYNKARVFVGNFALDLGFVLHTPLYILDCTYLLDNSSYFDLVLVQVLFGLAVLESFTAKTLGVNGTLFAF